MTPEARADIAKLIPLLGSDQDGEALAALRAIGRKLASRGRSFHDLAALVGGGAPAAPPPQPAPAPRPAWGLSAALMAEKVRLLSSPRLQARMSPWERAMVSLIARTIEAGAPLTKQHSDFLDRTYAKTLTGGVTL